MKIILTVVLFAMMSAFTNPINETLYEFPVTDIDGNEMSLEKYKGKVILIVNVASKCGYTPQYEGLQAIYEEYSDDGLVILGFPANNFKGQEPGTEEDIKQFCTLNYGVTFPMSSKVSVKGEDQDPLFGYLTSQPNQDFEGEINWNFEKFLINKEGNLIRRFRSKVKPESKEIQSAIKSLL
ncbi:MAG: glutathione peroxidase [Balneolaceae bacterium]|nr:glutathione peroxidase [Balneolaceae bacterium]MBO6545550.1 glutathione peroxidase [Balneolaceae bacterium]MBO6646946.1 glutathione peroxidase [Balneolaceae bacterium]